MPAGISNVQIGHCRARPKDPRHPCDPPPDECNPADDDEGDCPQPYICLEKLKNPGYGPPEPPTCKEGDHINVKSCAKPEPQHPCDPLPPCSTMKAKRPCHDLVLCYHRIKNPEWPRKPITSDCDPTLP